MLAFLFGGRMKRILFCFLTLTSSSVFAADGSADANAALANSPEQAVRTPAQQPQQRKLKTQSKAQPAHSVPAEAPLDLGDSTLPPIPDSHAPSLQGTEFFWQPRAHHLAASLRGGYITSQYDVTFTTTGLKATSENFNGYALQGDIEYGLNKTIALGISTGFADIRDQTTPIAFQQYDTHISGMSDIYLLAKGTSPIFGALLQYGANLGISPGKHILYSNAYGSNSFSQNNYSGGISFDPYLGASLPVGPGYLGVKIDYKYLADQSYENQNYAFPIDYTVSGGSILTALGFYELQLPILFVDLYGGIRQVGAVTTTFLGANYSSDPYTAPVVGINGTIHITSDLATGLGYEARILPDVNQTNSYQKNLGHTENRFNAMARYEF
jgi:hypothetical protein